jgi:hypothetical protein
VAAPVRKCREATATGADGVVAHKQRFGVSDHPVRSVKGGLRNIFLDVASVPSSRGGDCSREKYVSVIANRSTKARDYMPDSIMREFEVDFGLS